MFLPEEGSQPRFPMFPVFNICLGGGFGSITSPIIGLFTRERDAAAAYQAQKDPLPRLNNFVS
jgi:hypothetical protein